MPHQCTSCGYVFADGSKEMLSGCPDCGGATFQFYPEGTEIPETPPDESAPDSEGGRVGRATSTVREWISSSSSSPNSNPSPSGLSTENPSGDSDDSSSDTAQTPDTTEKSTVTDTATTDTADNTDNTVATETTAETETQNISPQVSEDEISENEADVMENKTSESESENAAQASARSEFVSPDELPSSPETQAPPSDGHAVREPTGNQPDLAELREELNDQFESIKIIEPGQYELNLMGLYDREEYIIALQENGRYVIQMPETWFNNDDE
jgi:predicted  nucleic acid-binding Zn-ribbon protein